MRKVLFTESQIKQILIKEGLGEWSDINSGYLDDNSSSGEIPCNISGTQVTVDPIDVNDPEKEDITTGDKVASSLNQRRANYGFGSKFTQPVYEDIEQQNFIANKIQKKNAVNGGTKMGQNIKNEKSVSNATQRKRKERLNDKKKELTRDQFKQRYGAIDKMVNSSLKQMSNINNITSNNSDTQKLAQANDVTKTKIKQGKGHHEGENLTAGRLHYFK